MKKHTRDKTHPDLKKGGPRRRGFVVTDARGEQTVLPFSGGTLPSSMLPAHATTHQFAGSDAIRIDDLASAQDNTDLNASISAHGLLPKLSGDVDDVLRGDGTFGQPTSASSAWIPLVDGSEPPVFITDGLGTLILVQVDV